ncbi:uncharacterized protein AB675_10052 [Cyphellophora attinorum]|uniref:MARVEL domain-containing protein n=1 Tax=Cyphellophora attinorum TaxID=1664694 RepID=A0A0N1NY95_9EURO|nr:uncharacterized protein AB675_10052 [Phialophora attinorum]KPI36623.1 hypothetical protein AB675_10052 [Phialophora attinorum]
MGFSRLTDRSGSSFAINGLNAIFRLLQLAFGIVVVGIYADVRHAHWWTDYSQTRKIIVTFSNMPVYGGQELTGHQDLPIAAGALTILTALVFGIMPFLLSYYFVAIAFLWDWIVFFVWCAAFGTHHKVFGAGWQVDWLKDEGYEKVDTLVAGQWLLLGGMLVQLMSAIMGPVCLLLDRKSLRASRAGV